MKRMGLTCPLGTSKEEDQAARCWELYLTKRHRELEDAMATLRKMNKHKYREVLQEIEDAIHLS